jgi:small conductance mechanosensitive channel
MNFEEIKNFIVNAWSNKFIQFLIATLAFIIVWTIATSILKSIKKRMIRKHIDTLATTIIITMILWGIRILLIIVYAGIVGVDTAGFAALITSAGVAIGLALQGSLSNLAGGIILAVTKPFKLDDYIESSGVSGTVEDMKLFYTELITPDNKVVMVPNGKLANDTIINYSTKDLRRVDLVFSIAYEDSVDKAIETIANVVENHSLILKNPGYSINESEHAGSSVNITTKVWVKNENYWTVHFDLLKQVHEAFDSNNITIPYTQIEVRTK